MYPSNCGCHSVVEMEKNCEDSRKHEELCVGPFTFEMHLGHPKGHAEEVIV